jgi:hypothetical protein
MSENEWFKMPIHSGAGGVGQWREAETGEQEQPPRERRETRGHANELGLGLEDCAWPALAFI